MEKKKSLVKNASILMVATIISRIIGLLYRRPMGAVIGTKGLGYYGYAYDLYAILLVISSYSIPMAVSKIVSEKLALKEYKQAHRIFKGALLYALIVGSVTAIVAFFGGRFLLPHNQTNALLAIRVLAPTILLSAFLGVLRGYFQAYNTMMPTSISQIAEQVVNAVISVLAGYLLIRGFATNATEKAIYGAAGGTLGTGAGVCIGLLFMVLVYMVNRKTFRRQMRRDGRKARTSSYREILGMIFMFVTPIIFTTFVYQASSYINSYLFSTILGFHHVAADTITAAYGEFSQRYNPMINVPLALASASAAAMMPMISGHYALGEKAAANKKINEAIRLTMFICIPAAAGLGVLAFPIMELVMGGSSLAGKLLIVGSISVIFSALSTITNSVLQSIGQQKIALRNAGISLLADVVLLVAILFAFPKVGIYAVVLVNIVFAVSMCILNTVSLRKFLGFKNEIRAPYLYPLAAAAGMGVFAWIIYYGLFVLTKRPGICLILAVVSSVLIYLVLYVVVSKIPKEEMARLPFGTKLVAVLKLIRIYR